MDEFNVDSSMQGQGIGKLHLLKELRLNARKFRDISFMFKKNDCC